MVYKPSGSLARPHLNMSIHLTEALKIHKSLSLSVLGDPGSLAICKVVDNLYRNHRDGMVFQRACHTRNHLMVNNLNLVQMPGKMGGTELANSWYALGAHMRYERKNHSENKKY